MRATCVMYRAMTQPRVTYSKAMIRDLGEGPRARSSGERRGYVHGVPPSGSATEGHVADVSNATRVSPPSLADDRGSARVSSADLGEEGSRGRGQGAGRAL